MAPLPINNVVNGFRVNKDNFGGAWCPKSSISPGVREWLEVDLGSSYRIRRTGTQGRFGGGRGQEFAELFTLEYWREETGKWIKYRNHSGHEVSLGVHPKSTSSAL
jgi:discoidin domain receptor family protein 2